MPSFPLSWLGVSPPVAAILCGGIGLLVMLGGWLVFGSGPRRRRGLNRVERLLQASDWNGALQLAQALRQGTMSVHWRARVRRAEAKCLQAAAAAAWKEKQYEQSLDLEFRAGQLLGRSEVEVRSGVIEAMLAEARRCFAASAGPDTDPVHQLLGRVLGLESTCLEAFFWKGLCHLREGNHEQAVAALNAARGSDTTTPSAVVDPSLYLGGLLLRLGQPKDALRYLTEANRIDGNCPLVKWQLGAALLAVVGDASLAVRALQQVLSPRGLPLWTQNSGRLWVEAFPENRSYVRKLAAQHAYVCPLWGSDLPVIVRQVRLALGQGLYRLGKFQDAADLFNRLAQESAPSLPVLRGLGLALARLERYDEAFKHLRMAHELEEPKDRITAGYLALCGARGKPSRPEDQGKNVSWALRLLTQFTAPGDTDWVQLVSTIFAEARALAVPLEADDQLYLCEHLVSVAAADPQAAAGYLQLAVEQPQAMRPEYAWLYCRAAQVHGLDDPQGVELFARTFAGRAEAQAFFAQHNWGFAEIEYAYLERAAKHQSGQFPAVLGPDYPAHGELVLLERAQREEAAGNSDAALHWTDVLHRLAPHNAKALDRLGALHYHRGNLPAARELLQQWQTIEPQSATPLVRLAVIQHQLGETDAWRETIRRGVQQAHGAARAAAAFLGARLAITRPADGVSPSASLDRDPVAMRTALEFLGIARHADPERADVLWLSAAIRTLLADRDGLAAQASDMQNPDVTDARYHYLAAICHLAAGNYAVTLDACRRAAKEPALAVESSYVVGWAHLHRQDARAAADALRPVAKTADSPSAAHAQALLAGIRFHQGAADEAIACWQALSPQQRSAWQLTQPLQQTVFLTALEALQAGRYEQAVERIREAGKLGLRERRLGALLSLALVKAGQKLLFA